MPSIVENKLNNTRLKLIREIGDISAIDTLLDELKVGKALSLAGNNGSLELMTGHIASEQHDRGYTLEYYKIKYDYSYRKPMAVFSDLGKEV